MSIPWRRTRPVVAVLLAVLVSVALTLVVARTEQTSWWVSLLPLALAPPVVCAALYRPHLRGEFLAVTCVGWLFNVVLLYWFLVEAFGQGS